MRHALPVYLPAGGAPFLTPLGSLGPVRNRGLLKMICMFGCRLSLDATFTPLQRATAAGSTAQRKEYFPSHDQCECSHLKDFEARLLGRRFPQRNGTSTVLRRSAGQSKKASQRLLPDHSARVGDERPVRIFMLVPTQVPTARTGSMMAFGQRRMISPIWMVQERP